MNKTIEFFQEQKRGSSTTEIKQYYNMKFQGMIWYRICFEETLKSKNPFSCNFILEDSIWGF